MGSWRGILSPRNLNAFIAGPWKLISLALGIDLVPYPAGESDELVRVHIHLEEPGSQVVALLAGIVDVVDQGLVVSLQLLCVLVVVLVLLSRQENETRWELPSASPSPPPLPQA